MKVAPETRYIVEVRKVLRDGDGNPLPAGDWPAMMCEVTELPAMTVRDTVWLPAFDDADIPYTECASS